MLAFQLSVAEDVAGAFNVSVTLAVLVIPPPITVIVPGWFPIARVAVFTLTVTVPLFVPDVALSDNQETSSLVIQVPFELMVTVWVPGFAAPCVAVKERLLGDTVNELAVTMRVTLTVLVVPPPVTVIAPALVPTDALPRLMPAVIVPFPDPDV